MSQQNTPAVIDGNAGTAVALPSDIQSKLAKYAVETQQTEIAPGQFFSTRAAQLTFGGQPIPNSTMDVVVVASMFESVYYPEKFNASQIAPPTCYAFSFSPTGAVPHPESTKAQAATCADCPHSKWTADPVDGKNRKACKEQRRLAIMPTSALADCGAGVEKATVGYLRVPVTSVKNWQAYAQAMAARGKPVFAAVTRVAVKPHPKNQMEVTFQHVRDITDPDELEAVMLRHEVELKAMAFPYAKQAPATTNPAAAPAAGPSKF